MTLDRVGLDLNALQNISAPVIDINQTASAILNELPYKAQEITGGYFAYIILFGILILTYWYLSDKNPLGDFRYSDLRALTLSLGIVSSIGLVQISANLIQNWMIVAFMLLGFTLMNVVLLWIDNRQ